MNNINTVHGKTFSRTIVSGREKLELEYSDVYEKYLNFPLRMIRGLIYPNFLQYDLIKAVRRVLEQSNLLKFLNEYPYLILKANINVFHD